jgi:acyl-CoA reductase-like NAD-dependent aldehyde dehydrogenase
MSKSASIAKQFIGGALVASARTGKSHSPADGSALGSYADADRAQGTEAVAAARAAFDDTDWSRDRHLRHRVLNEIADGIERRTGDLVTMLARENGKVLGEAGFELSLTPSKLRYYGALALTETGRAAEVKPGVHMTSIAEAIGVAGVIVPWNSPVVLAVRSFAPALAAGCTAVVKLPGQTGLVNGILHEILADVGSLPPGVLNSLTESGDEVSRLLVESHDVDALSYTGSTRVGRLILAEGAKHLKRISLELGGKSPMIVFEDADLDVVVPTLTAAVTTFSGQFCMTGSRILVQRSVAAELRERLSKSLAAVKVGPGDDPTSEMGPMIDAANAQRVDAIVREAEGYATVLVRGGPTDPSSAYYYPSLVEVDDPTSPIVQQEVFGPVATFEVFDTEPEAIRLANITEYGLSASVWSRDIDRPRRVATRLRAGTVWANAWALVVDQFEEGGFKQSGIGRLNGLRALEEFQEYKTFAQVVG